MTSGLLATGVAGRRPVLGASEPSGTILLGTEHGYTANDPATGESLWSVDLDPADWGCSLSSPDHWVVLGGEYGDSDGPERVLCCSTTGGTTEVLETTPAEM